MTIVQKQCLLAALGLYPYREIDGIWGAKSRTAMGDFEAKFPGKTLQDAVSEIGQASFWEGVRHWTREEFCCHCGGQYCDGFPAEPDETLVSLLEDVRADFGAPAICSSGVRCPQHKANVGGVANSKHLSGKAADFMVLGITGQTLLNRVRSDPRTHYAYIIDDGPYVHVDVT